MGSYRPPQHGYGPPPGQDPHARPGSTTIYNQQPSGAHGYGSPVSSMSSPWNAPPSQQHHSNSIQYSSSQASLPPPPPGPPPVTAPLYNTYNEHSGGGYGRAPSLPPRISQPYGLPVATPYAVQQAFQTPAYGTSQPQGHHRVPSVPSAYHQEVSQNTQAWPQHPPYSNQPTTHHYDPPLPLRPASQGKPSAEDSTRYNVYDQPQPQQSQPPGPPQVGQPGDPSHYPAQPGYQQYTAGHSYEPSPSSASVYSPDDPSHPNYQPPSTYQASGGYVPPPPPKPQQYDAQHGGPSYPSNDAQPSRPSSTQHAYQQPYGPPASSGYPVVAPTAQYGQEHSSQRPSYAAYQTQPTAGSGAYPQTQQEYGRQTPSQAPPRPYSNPQAQHGYPRPLHSSEEQPVSPLQGRQSVSFERPGSIAQSTAGAPAAPPPPSAKPVSAKPASSFAFSSEWEHFGPGADEIDDTAMYGVKTDEKDIHLASVELPASAPPHARPGSEISAPESFHPSPAVMPAAGIQHPAVQSTPPPPSIYAPTPPTGYPSQEQNQQRPPAHQSIIMDEGDYIPSMPNTPPAAQRPVRAPIVLGGSSRPHQGSPAAPSVTINSGTYQTSQPTPDAIQQTTQVRDEYSGLQPLDHVASPPPNATPVGNQFVMGEGNWQQGHIEQANMVAGFSRSPATAIDSAELRKAQQQAEDLEVKLSELQTALSMAQSSVTEKCSVVAQRDSIITEKDAIIKQKDIEIAQRAAHLSELQASLSDITETFETLKSSTSGLEVQLKTSQAVETDLRSKLRESETVSLAAKAAHVDETQTLNKKLNETHTSLAAALTEAGELKKRLDEEKSKAEAKAAEPLDIAPGLEPWSKGSLERFKEMLYTESKPIPVQEKLQIFMEFVNAETRLRGINLPFGPKGEVKGFDVPQLQAQPPTQSKETKPGRLRLTPPRESDDFVMVDSEAELQYSPGGRPILNAAPEEYSPGGRPMLRQPRVAQVQSQPPTVRQESGSSNTPKDNPSKPAYQPFRADTLGSGPSARGPDAALPATAQHPKPAYQPFSWKQGEPLSQVSATSQTPPSAPVTATTSQTPVYKPLYKPHPIPANGSTAHALKQSSNTDILLDHVPGMKVGGKKETVRSPQDETMLPMPLKTRIQAPSSDLAPTELPAATTPRDVGPPAAHPGTSLQFLTSLVQAVAQPQPSKRVREFTDALDAIDIDSGSIRTMTKTWEDKAAATRSLFEKERAHRQAELEKRNNELYDSGEIGYGDFETLEGQANEEEMRSKAEEDAEEYKSYSRDVFDVVFKKCQNDIGALVKMQGDIEGLLRESAAGRCVIGKSEKDKSLSQAMDLLLKVHGKLELVHIENVKAVQERDRKYKLTQTKPLYAKGDITGMKRVEKAFDEAEKKADVRARVERAERCKRIWKIMDAEMERGAIENEDFAADIIAAAEKAADMVDDGEKTELLRLISDAHRIVIAVYEDTIDLMRIFEHIDMQLNECEYDVSVASARLKGDEQEYFERLEREKKKEDVKLREDGEKRLNAVEEHRKEAEGQLSDLERIVERGGEEREARSRKERALEEARRRNGEV